VSDVSKKSSMPAGAAEAGALIVGVVGIAIPVALAGLAAAGGSTIVLILAILAMFGVGGAALTVVLKLAGEGEHPDEPGEQ
jgi:hypothetical protein